MLCLRKESFLLIATLIPIEEIARSVALLTCYGEGNRSYLALPEVEKLMHIKQHTLKCRYTMPYYFYHP